MTDDAKARPFAADFPVPDEARWRALAEAALKGASWEKLVGRTADGAPIAPLYRESDFDSATDAAGFPGQAPFVRGAHGARDALQPWHIRQRFAHPDPRQTNKDILADLDGGVSAVELVVDPSGAAGVAIATADDLAAALDGVLVDLAPVALDAGAHGVATAALLADYLADAGEAAAPPAFDMDPVGALMRTGAMGEGDLAAAAALAEKHRGRFSGATWLRADARAVHEAGGSEAQEIAAALSSGIAALRALTHAGFSAADAARAISFTLAVGADMLVETAKLRALRLTWARVLEGAGVRAPDAQGARLNVVTSRRMMTRHDPWTNMLRTTAACFAGAVGGANAIAVLPLTEALGLPTPFARRMARNTQLILMQESNLGRVIDPAGGAWFVEKLTRDLAEAAWTIMQGIEAAGGIVAALQAGGLQKDVAAIRARREKAFATRRETITGVTDFPLLGADLPAVVAGGARTSGPQASTGGPEVRAPNFTPLRWSEPFEALRDKGEAAKAKVFCANLGPLAEFSARANFAKNLFAAGGVDALGADVEFADAAAIGKGFAASGANVAVLTGTDARYATDAAPAAAALKAAGCIWIVYAGKLADEAPLRAAGVDQFIMAGQDALAALATLHAALGIKA